MAGLGNRSRPYADARNPKATKNIATLAQRLLGMIIGSDSSASTNAIQNAGVLTGESGIDAMIS